MAVRLERIGVELGGPQAALDAVDLEIGAGEQLALIGPSGAGKTTALSVLGAALRPSRGGVSIDGIDPWLLDSANLRALRRRLFVAPQAPPLPPRQRVVTTVLAGRLPNWSLWQSLRSLWHPGDAQAAFNALEQFSIGDKLWNHVDQLSGGERQRVGLARSLLSDAQLLLYDEPLSALDPTLADQTITTLIRTASSRGATLVCNLHHVDIALAHFPRVVGLRAGRIVFDGAPGQLSRSDITELYAPDDQADAAIAVAAGVVSDGFAESTAGPRPTRCF